MTNAKQMEERDYGTHADDLMGPELPQDRIQDMRVLFESVVEAVNIHSCCADIIYCNWMYFTAIFQRRHAPDIIYQISHSMESEADEDNLENDLRIRIELFDEETRPGMTGLDYLRPQPRPATTDVVDTAELSIIFAADSDSLTTTIRKTLVKIKTTLIQESRLDPSDIPGAEGNTNYTIDDFDIIYAGEQNLWDDELKASRTYNQSTEQFTGGSENQS